VIFGSGDTTQTFPVLITKNAYHEGPTTVNLSLSNPTGGASLGTPNQAALVIIDDATVPTNSQPIDDPATFVCQHYHDFLGREPDAAGQAYWTNQITQCGNDATCIHNKRVDVSNAFFFELEFQQTGAYVARVYVASFDQFPTYQQFMPDRARVVGGPALDQSKAAFALVFVGRPAFVSRYPRSMTAQQFVDALLATEQQASGVDLSSERSMLISEYDGTDNGRATILRQVADNTGFAEAEYNPIFVLTQYFGYLRRDFDPNGFFFWLDQVNHCPIANVGAQHAMVCSFITSLEYQNRFSAMVTHTNQECPQSAVCSP
jgi:hypothetical protein